MKAINKRGVATGSVMQFTFNGKPRTATIRHRIFRGKDGFDSDLLVFESAHSKIVVRERIPGHIPRWDVFISPAEAVASLRARGCIDAANVLAKFDAWTLHWHRDLFTSVALHVFESKSLRTVIEFRDSGRRLDFASHAEAAKALDQTNVEHLSALRAMDWFKYVSEEV